MGAIRSSRTTRISSIFLTCIDTAEGVRNTALAAEEKFPVSPMATKVRRRSRSRLCIDHSISWAEHYPKGFSFS